MEAAPRLPMIQFNLLTSNEPTSFGTALKQYIQAFYNEEPESYSNEIHSLEGLRALATRPTVDISGCEALRKYYCQLHFLKSRFPMEEGQPAAVHFSWKSSPSSSNCTVGDIRFELMCVLYNIGALHTQLGAADLRTSPEGMKMACTHFQCAAWAFQTIKETYGHSVNFISSFFVIHFFQQVCLAQAQECILEKSMLDNRKASSIAKVAVQVYDYYRSALNILQNNQEEAGVTEGLDYKVFKGWIKYLSFKLAYHKCIALLFQGQQAEEQQKMGERVAFYQAACEQLEDARKLATNFKNQQEYAEALAFTLDVVEGKRKAAKNENEFIYHEEVPAKEALQEVKGASLVKGIPFSVNDPEVSGQDIFARLVPMEAHEAASLYSEKKAEFIRELGELVDNKDQAVAEFMSSMQLEFLNKVHLSTGIPQEIVDRAAAMNARPAAIQDLVDSMGKLSNIFHEVESMLNEIDMLLQDEEKSEKEYQESMGKRPPSIVATDLAREAAKYREAHTKANDSNQTLHRAMTAHVANLKILQQPLRQLQQQLPNVDLKNENVDHQGLVELEALVSKVEEMRSQRAMLWAEFREALHNDDITGVLVTKQPEQTLDQVFKKELEKHKQMSDLIKQNTAAQENIKKALVECYAKTLNSRRFIQDIIQKRQTTINALMTSYDAYDDLLAKANKGIEFYTKLETNVTKLLQRLKGACNVQQEERDQMLSKNEPRKLENAPQQIVPSVVPPQSSTPKLKDYLEARKNKPPTPAPAMVPPQAYPQYPQDPQVWPPGVRPAPLGSEVNEPMNSKNAQEAYGYSNPYFNQQTYQYPTDVYASQNNYSVNDAQQINYPTDAYSQKTVYNASEQTSDKNTVINRMNNLSTSTNSQPNPSDYYGVKPTSYTSYIPQNYPATYSYNTQPTVPQSQPLSYTNYDPAKANTTSTYSYVPISSNIGSSLPTHNIGSSLPTPDTSSTYSQYKNPANYPSDAATGYNNPSSTPTSSVGNYQQPTSYSDASSYPNPTGSYTSMSGSYSSSEVAAPYQSPASAYPNITPISTNYQKPIPDVSNYQNTAMPSQTNYQYPDAYSQYYPQGYAPGYSNEAAPASDYPTYNYHSNQYASSVQPNVSNANTATYSSPTVETASSHTPRKNSMTASTDQQYNYQNYQYPYPTQTPPAGYASNQNYGSYDYQQGQGYNQQNYAQGTQQQADLQQVVQPAPEPQPKKESNIDLLTGLDFSINQAPLVPQQKTIEKQVEPSKEEIKADRKPKPSLIEKTPSVEKPKAPQVKILPSKVLNNEEVKRLFNQELEKFEKYVDVLSNKTLSGPTNLDLKWKEIQDKQDADGHKKIISVARCYPMKNRYPDILPYDSNRVELVEPKDDYINASYLKDVSPYAPLFILTQAPLPSTFVDFWTLIREQQVELIFCLLNDSEIGNDVYWPKEKGQNLTVSNMVISLQSVIVKTNWVERLISVAIPEKRESWVVLHLQFTSWPGSLFPTSPESFVEYTKEVINLHNQQRNIFHPVVVHCSSSIGRAGLIPLLTTAILDVTNNPTSIPDLAQIVMKLSNSQKNVLRDREHLRFAYEAFVCYIKQVVTQDKLKSKLNDVVVNSSINTETQPTVEVKDVNADPLSSLDPFWASKK
ncbi:unnamed protein product [Brassicogethes aeneus]|uniref:Tyrosine-protein phosphatase non-receptor type 23 n=1 Tax=Brassicogethes aeneus TaxID=1431903 RepID=A0A9P0FJR0_BRAAE|nr:unnamed protein product [Brassicogethes aeneus]